jgi:hypothetical protein
VGYAVAVMPRTNKSNDEKMWARRSLAEEKTAVARFLLVHDTKTGKNVPNQHKMYQMVIKYPECP